MEAKIRRQQAMQDARQAMVLGAAKVVIARLGLEGASIREIAREAGYTPGALYAYFSNKQALLLALLDDALAKLAETTWQARPVRGQAQPALLVKGDAWLSYLLRNPQELELVLYFLGTRAQQTLDRESASRVHTAIRATLQPLADLLQAAGMPAEQLEPALEALLAQGCGLLMAQDSTRLQAPRMAPQALFADYLQRLLVELLGDAAQEVEATSADAHSANSAQVDLFG